MAARRSIALIALEEDKICFFLSSDLLVFDPHFTPLVFDPCFTECNALCFACRSPEPCRSTRVALCVCHEFMHVCACMHMGICP